MLSSVWLFALSTLSSRVLSLTIYETVQLRPELSSFAALLEEPEYDFIKTALDNSSATYTLWAPINQSIVDVPFPIDPDIIAFHITLGSLNDTELDLIQYPITFLNNSTVVNMDGQGQRVSITRNPINQNIILEFDIPKVASRVVERDIQCDNGWVHTIDMVLEYPKRKAIEAATAWGGLDSFVAAVNATDLVATFDDQPSVTIFAPNDMAMAGALQFGLLTPAQKESFMLYHVSPDVAYLDELLDGEDFVMMNGQNLRVSYEDGPFRLYSDNNVTVATIVEFNIQIPNGVMHVIDYALFPAYNTSEMTMWEAAIVQPDLGALVNLLNTPNYTGVRDLLNTTANLTLFAPTNDALTAAGIDPADVNLTTAVLTYHVLNSVITSDAIPSGFTVIETLMTSNITTNLGGKGQVLVVNATQNVTLNFGLPGDVNETANVIRTDVSGTNGVVHVVDKVLLPPGKVSNLAVGAGLSDLVGFLVDTDLVSTVDTTADITIFAPTNAAFEAAREAGFADQLNETDSLTTILTSHVFAGALYSSDLSEGQILTSLQGAEFTVSISAAGGVFVGGSQVLVANALSENGVVHLINGVLGVYSPPQQNEDEDGLSTLAIFGIVAAVLVVLGGLFLCYRKQKADRYSNMSEGYSSSSAYGAMPKTDTR